MTTINRSSSFTEIPTINDVLPGFHISTWFGIFGPANLPKATTDQLQKAFAAALNTPDTAEKFARMSATPSPMTSADFSYMVMKEHADYGRLIKVAKIKLDWVAPHSRGIRAGEWRKRLSALKIPATQGALQRTPASVRLGLQAASRRGLRQRRSPWNLFTV